jgi:hypothetical protein
VRAIAAEVGIGKSVVGARIARAEAAERARAESPASTQAMSATANRRAASATSSSDRLVAGPINVRAQLEAIAQDPKAGSRERLGALQTLAKLDKAAGGPPPSDEIRPRRIGTLALEPQRAGDALTYRLWQLERLGWASSIDGLSPRQAWALLACALFADELGEDFLAELPADEPEDEDEDEDEDPEPEPGNHEEPERRPRPEALRTEPAIT